MDWGADFVGCDGCDVVLVGFEFTSDEFRRGQIGGVKLAVATNCVSPVDMVPNCSILLELLSDVIGNCDCVDDGVVGGVGLRATDPWSRVSRFRCGRNGVIGMGCCGGVSIGFVVAGDEFECGEISEGVVEIEPVDGICAG